MPDPEIARKQARGDCIAGAHIRISDIVPCGLDYQQRARLTDMLSQVWDDGYGRGRDDEAAGALAPDSGKPDLPAVTQIRAWLLAHGWTPGSPGVAGTLWHPPNGSPPVGVPDDDEDTGFTAGAISRIADRGGHFADEVVQEMLAAPREGTAPDA